MKEFCYVIKEEEGLHARPAGLLAKEAAKYQSDISLLYKGKRISAKKLFSLMGLAVKCGETIELVIEGSDEDLACQALRDFFEANL